MSGRRCFMMGHRDAAQDIYPALCAAVEKHIVSCGVTEFIVGHYGRFDTLAANAVKAIKQKYKVQLILLLPYHPTEKFVPLPDGFDGTCYPPGMERVPRRFAIVRANQYMVDHTEFLIAYAWRSASNAKNLLEYARKKERKGKIQITVLTPGT